MPHNATPVPDVGNESSITVESSMVNVSLTMICDFDSIKSLPRKKSSSELLHDIKMNVTAGKSNLRIGCRKTELYIVFVVKPNTKQSYLV